MRLAGSLAAIAVVLLLDPTTSRADPHDEVLRPLQPWIGAAIDLAAASPTFVALRARLTSARVIVHLSELRSRAPWDGRTIFVAFRGEHRYVRVELRRGAPTAVAALLAHELQHVVELDEADVRSVPAAADYYRRHGRQVGDNAFDTDAAVAAGWRTLHELTGRPMSWRLRRIGRRTHRASLGSVD